MEHTTARTTIAEAWARVGKALIPLDAAGWRTPTRLAGWRVADLAVHVVWGVSMEAQALSRAAAGRSGPASGLLLDPATPPARVLEALEAARAELLTALDRLAGAPDERPVPLPGGPFPLAFARDVLTMEAGIHADDLAAALGRPAPLPAPVVAASLAVLRAYLPVMGAAGTPPAPGTRLAIDGDAVRLGAAREADGWRVTTPDADAELRIVGADEQLVRWLLGRLSLADPSLRVTGTPALANAADGWFVGP